MEYNCGLQEAESHLTHPLEALSAYPPPPPTQGSGQQEDTMVPDPESPRWRSAQVPERCATQGAKDCFWGTFVKRIY